MKTACVLALATIGAAAMAAEVSKVPPMLKHEMKSISGEKIKLADYHGKVLLIVNVASECGATPQYKQLQALHDKYNDAGLEVLGFPCNQFGSQEPGSAADIQKFCKDNYSVTFDMFDKVDVNGDKAAPLFQQLTTDPKFAGKVDWNFEKFLINREGKLVGRFKTGVKPDAPEVVQAIEHELAKK
jgi:glutathione peroxidase